MSDASSSSPSSAAAASDSPWFWMMLFSAAGLLVLAMLWPKYVQRQARLELQFRAGEEMARRGFEGEAPARPPGQEGEAPPPQAGTPIVTLWPIAVALALLLAVSGGMFWRTRRAAAGAWRAPPGGAP
jgi:hypothetical protein